MSELLAQIERDDMTYEASQAMSEKHRRNWVEACQEREALRADRDLWRDNYFKVVRANQDYDRLAAEVEALRADAALLWETHTFRVVGTQCKLLTAHTCIHFRGRCVTELLFKLDAARAGEKSDG